MYSVQLIIEIIMLAGFIPLFERMCPGLRNSGAVAPELSF